jgi:hypothetical protein
MRRLYAFTNVKACYGSRLLIANGGASALSPTLVSQRWKNGSADGDAVFELCTRLSLKEFGSVLINLLTNRVPFYRTPPEDQAVPFTAIFVLS